MPKHRLPGEIWAARRRQVWLRDGKKCRGPYYQNKGPLPLNKVHIDHIHSGKLVTNAVGELRTLCRRCHALRIDQRHRGMIASALWNDLIPANWRKYLWDDELHWPSEETIAELNHWIAMQEKGQDREQ